MWSFFQMEDLKSIVKCLYCNQTYVQAVDLPCQNLICFKDIHEMQMGESKQTNVSHLFCPYCEQTHQVPEKGFPRSILWG